MLQAQANAFGLKTALRCYELSFCAVIMILNEVFPILEVPGKLLQYLIEHIMVFQTNAKKNMFLC